MPHVFPGRFTARVDEPIVVFLIGMRINRPWKLWKWLPVAAAMPRMMRELEGDPEHGLLHSQGGLLAGGPVLLQYWRSFEHLERFAKSKLLPHLSAWGRFNREVGAGGDVGIWHETYLVEPGATESIYTNMPRWGMAAATRHVSASGVHESARQRLGRPPVAAP
ncbi:MAG TPA: DUF4188 domain-containing protein [Thermoanaerobaculia bacterium]|nr:DUF4188 domain-containing protein [Thermoanaerobaculia bacterium]